MGHGLPLAGALSAVVSHIHDLVALSLGAAGDYQRVAEEGGARAARLGTIKADIAAHLGDCELNVNGVAARHGVTPRYVQKLGLTVGGDTSDTSWVYRGRKVPYHRTIRKKYQHATGSLGISNNRAPRRERGHLSLVATSGHGKGRAARPQGCRVPGVGHSSEPLISRPVPEDEHARN